MRSLFPLKPYEHQITAMDFCEVRSYYALLMEQGTGKTAVLLNDVARRYDREQIDCLLVMAPSGVHTNWVLREIPKHLPEWANPIAAEWYSGPTKAERLAIETVMQPSARLRIFAMNWEALATVDGLNAAVRFMRSAQKGAMLVCDESQNVKSPKAIRTRKLLQHLKPLAKVRAISTGTAITNAPFDAFSQFGFLDDRILKTTSFTAFKAEYAELLPPGHGLLRHIATRTRGQYAPQIVARDAITGLPKWRNLDKLKALIAPHSFRVLKKDCLDLPDKVYTQRYFRMTAKQAKAYAELRDDLRLRIGEDTILPVQRIAAMTKLSQVVSGYFIPPAAPENHVERLMPLEDNPKIAVLIEEVKDCVERGEQVIIWARFHAEIADIVKVLAAEEITYVEYHGGIKPGDRSDSLDKFERGEAKVFLGQQAAGGTGITAVAPNSVARTMTVIYYSNTWALTDRIQSEDRAHRIGQDKTVRYLDIVVKNTLDEKIASALAAKTDLAQFVMGDKRRALEVLS